MPTQSMLDDAASQEVFEGIFTNQGNQGGLSIGQHASLALRLHAQLDALRARLHHLLAAVELDLQPDALEPSIGTIAIAR